MLGLSNIDKGELWKHFFYPQLEEEGGILF